MSFQEYWQCRRRECFVKSRVRAEGVGFVLFVSLGFIKLRWPNLPFDETVWWSVAGVFVLALLWELCFVSPYRHVESLISDHKEEVARCKNEASTLRCERDAIHAKLDHTLASIAVLPLRIEALPISKNKDNRTQEGQDVVFDGNCLVGLHNPNPTQGIGATIFTLLGVAPPLRSAHEVGPRVDDESLRQVQFPIPGTQNSVLQGGQRRPVNLFTATRPPCIQATLKNIVVRFNGEWRSDAKNEFTPTQAEHILTMEVSGSGTGATEVQLRVLFSTDQEEQVFSVTKLSGLTDAEQVEADNGKAMFLAVVDKIVAGVKPLRALQEANAHELTMNDMLIQFCHDLVKFGHPHPFASLKGIIPQHKWLGFLLAARHQGLNLSNEQHLLDLLAEQSPTIKPL
jgi:hypothetical protein